MSVRADVLIGGATSGRVLRLDAPISFWGGVDPATSEVTLAGHPQRGERIAGLILVVPRLIGSSSSSAVMLELLHGVRAPAALILGQRDAILPIGVIAARQMGWPTIPVLVVADPPYITGTSLMISETGLIENNQAASG
ncbi:MAG: DUF126 domain-containing protein [Pseudomonadota bacterium]